MKRETVRRGGGEAFARVYSVAEAQMAQVQESKHLSVGSAAGVLETFFGTCLEDFFWPLTRFFFLLLSEAGLDPEWETRTC